MPVKKQDPEEWFHQSATTYVQAQILFHLNQTGVINFIFSNGPSTSKEIAEKLNLVTGTLETLLDYAFHVDEIFQRDSGRRYEFSEFGRAVLKRYGREVNGMHHFNFFDVRLGGYEPVWNGLSKLLKGEAKYGNQIHRRGEFAAEGLFTSSIGFFPTLKTTIESVETPGVVEFGVSTGLLMALAQTGIKRKWSGLDRNPSELLKADSKASALGVTGIKWIEADLYAPNKWAKELFGLPQIFFSVHFHEFMAKGWKANVDLLKSLRERFSGSYVIALEQPRKEIQDRDKLPKSQWLYSQSNVLIHHLVGNGNILTESEWSRLFEEAGCSLVKIDKTGYLGYYLFMFRF